MKKLLFVLVVLSLAVAACTPGLLEPQPSAEPTRPEASPTPVPPAEPQVTPTLPVSEVPEAILKLAYDDLAAGLNVTWGEIRLVSAEPVDFPNSCLGIETPGMGCLDVITPGYRIQLQAGSSIYTYVSNLKGEKVYLAQAAGPSVKTTPVHDRVVLTWSRNGGIAGFCDELRIHASGLVVVTSCKAALRSFQLAPQEQKLLAGWLEKYAALEYEERDEDAVADGMSVKLTLAGTGTLKMGEDEQKQLLEFVSEISQQP